MDKEVAQVVAYFRDNASDLKTLGKEWGLSDEEIDECIQQAMSVDPKDLPPPETTASRVTRLKFSARKWWPKLKIPLSVIGILFVLLFGLSLAAENEQVEHRLGQLLQPLFYPVLRFVRLAAVPLHSVFNAYDFFLSECLVTNPLFVDDRFSGDHICENCFKVTVPTEYTAASLDKGSPPVEAFTSPILVRGRARTIDLATFQTILSHNKFNTLPMLGITTNLQWAKHISDLLKEDAAEKLATQPDFHFNWFSKEASVSQLMRKVFSRPDVLGRKAEVSLQKHIFLSGPEVKSSPLPLSSSSAHHYYIQGSGSRRIELTPVPMCQSQCSPMSVILTAGDMLIFDRGTYTAEVKPHGDDISISFLGFFTPV